MCGGYSGKIELNDWCQHGSFDGQIKIISIEPARLCGIGRLRSLQVNSAGF